MVLVVCLSIATVFVLLSRWQLSSSEQGRVVFDPAKEVVRPLEDVVPAGEPALASFADQAVQIRGRYVEGSTVMIPNRIHDGETGWWVVQALEVTDSADRWPDAGSTMVIAVVRGWVPDAHGGHHSDAASQDVVVVGRFLPPEAPVSTEGLTDDTYASLSPAQLTNVWDAPVYSGFVVAWSESHPPETPQLGEGHTLPQHSSLLTDQVQAVRVDQQPADHSVNWLNVFYAVEWLVFAAFALWIWARFVADMHRRQSNPEEWFVLGGDQTPYYWDEQTKKYYYYDPVAKTYYFFDDQDPESDVKP